MTKQHTPAHMICNSQSNDAQGFQYASMHSLVGTLHGTGRATKSPRTSSYGEDPRALPAIPDQLNALGLTTIPEDGLASLGKQLMLFTNMQSPSCLVA